MILSLKDLILAITLFINAAAVLNFDVKEEEKDTVKGKIFKIISTI